MSKFCSHCGNPLLDNVNNCPSCGQSHVTSSVPLSKEFNKYLDTSAMVQPKELRISPTVAAILSFIIVGIGQMINGQLVKGIIMLILNMLISFATRGFIGFIGTLIIGILSALDAYKCSKKLEEGTPIGKFSFLV